MIKVNLAPPRQRKSLALSVPGLSLGLLFGVLSLVSILGIGAYWWTLTAEAARLDFDTLTFPAQELIVNLPGQVLRITDVVAEVKTVTGEPETIIVHVEVEANEPRPLPQRMFDY